MADKNATKTRNIEKKNHRIIRPLLRILAVLLVLAALICAAVFLYVRYTKTHYEIRFYQETSQKVGGNLRIAVISDLHNREYGENNETLISDLRSLKPDLILFPGKPNGRAFPNPLPHAANACLPLYLISLSRNPRGISLFLIVLSAVLCYSENIRKFF